MMISPQSYVKEHENDTFEELIKERNELVKSIKRLEKKLFSEEKMNEEVMVCPGTDVEYQVELMYLAELCNFMSEKFNKEIVWGEEEDFEE
jgi:hypothetical protein